MQISIKMVIDILFFVAFMIVGRAVILSAARNIVKGHIFDEKFLMSIASIGAICLGEVVEAFGIMAFYQLGELISDKAEDNGQKAIEDLCNMQSDKARLVKNKKGANNNDGGVKEKVASVAEANESADKTSTNIIYSDSGDKSNSKVDNATIETQIIDATDVKVGDILQVLAGERIPCDGVIKEGNGFIDNSALTGESTPIEITAGSEVFSGAINQNSVILVKVTHIAKESSAAKIIDLMKNAQEKKSSSECFITKFAKVYTPIVCIMALLVAILPPLIKVLVSASGGGTLHIGDNAVWVHRALMFLVVSCPCALVISVPLALVGGLASCAKSGILVKSSKALETLSKTRTALFDKTGTLTRGSFSVKDVHLSLDCPCERDTVIAVATHAQRYSTHPIAIGLKQCHRCPNCLTVALKNTIETAGFGVHTILDGDTVIVGNDKLMARNNIALPKCTKNDVGTIVHVALNNKYLGHIIINDEVRGEAPFVIKALKKLGVKRLAMLTGDKNDIAKAVARDIGLSEYHADLLPEDKVAIAQSLRDEAHKGKGALIFTGDGINDSPVIALSDVGVAMGAIGRQAAIDASDIVIMSDNLRLLPISLKTSKHTMGIVYQNVIASITIKVAIMVLGALGISGMWLAVFGDAGVSTLAVLNALRARKKCNV